MRQLKEKIQSKPCDRGKIPEAVLVCRDPSRKKKPGKKKLSSEEKEKIKRRMEVLRPLLLSKKPVPLIGTKGPLKRSPHLLMDVMAADLTGALFRMPLFFAGATRRMLEPKYRIEIPDPCERFKVIKKMFLNKYGLKSLPQAYEYVVMQACLYFG